jgi:hypothetical protein
MKSFLIGAAIVAPFILISVLPSRAEDTNAKSMTARPNANRSDYTFELANTPKPSGTGKNIVAVKLLHDGKPVTGAIIIQSRADMGPIGMEAMTALIKPLGEQPPGTYRFEVANGSVWKKADNWALNFSAKVQGVAQTVTGKVVVKLTP